MNALLVGLFLVFEVAHARFAIPLRGRDRLNLWPEQLAAEAAEHRLFATPCFFLFLTRHPTFDTAVSCIEAAQRVIEAAASPSIPLWLPPRAC